MTDPGKPPGNEPGGHGVTYASAGVDIEAGDRAVDLFKPLAIRATSPEVRGGLGGCVEQACQAGCAGGGCWGAAGFE